jgi:hypothetical protein
MLYKLSKMSEMTKNDSDVQLESTIPITFLLSTDRQRYPIKSAGNVIKSELIDKLKSAILAEDINVSNKIASDMIISYYFRELWDIFFEIWIEYIHLKHIGMLMWLLKNHNVFNNLKTKDNNAIINNQEIRNMIAQIVTILCIQPKLKIEIYMNSNAKSAELSANSKELATYYYKSSLSELSIIHDEDSMRVILSLAQFIEFYNNNSLKNSYYWINELLLSKKILKPYKGFRISKKISSKPIILIWSIMYTIAEKKSIDTIIMNDLRQLFMHFLLQSNLTYSLLYTYIMVSYVKHHQIIKFNPVDILDRRVLKAVLCINFCYISRTSPTSPTSAPISSFETDVILTNVGKKKSKPVIINTNSKLHKLKIRITP